MGPAVGHGQQGDQHQQRPGHHQHLVPSALMGQDRGPIHIPERRLVGSAGHPPGQGEAVRQEIERIVEAIRPAIQADQGDIDLVDVDEATGVVTVELHGACVTCPASTQTLKAGIERIMKDRVDGVTEVVEVNALGMSESSVWL